MTSSLAVLAKVLSRRMAVAMFVNEPCSWSIGVILFDSSVLEATAYGTINRHLAGVLMHLFHHKLSSAVSFESANIWITLYERGS